MSKFRVLIVEDEPVIAENISMYLDNNDFEVSGIAYDSGEAIEQLQNNTPDAAILDINLESEEDGIDIANFINQRYQIPFLFLTSYSDKETLQRAKNVNPSGYIVKPFNEKTNNKMPLLTMDKINRYLLSPLSDREFEVVQLIYEGITNNQIAERIFVSVNTVKTHLKSIYLKLDANTRYGVIIRLRELISK